MADVLVIITVSRVYRSLTGIHDVLSGWHESQYEFTSSTLLAGSVLGME